LRRFDKQFKGLLGVFSNQDCWQNPYSLSRYYFPTGMPNLGNTCYMNALLQSLTGCKMFMDYVKRLHLRVVVDHADKDDMIVDSLARVLMGLRKGVVESNPSIMYHIMCEEFTSMHEQQDSHEFMFYLQDKITRITAKLIRKNTFD